MNNSLIEHCYVTLIFATKKLCYYFLVHCLNLVTNLILSSTFYLDQLYENRYSMAAPAKQFDITVVTHKGLQSEALSDMLAQFLSGEHDTLFEDEE